MPLTEFMWYFSDCVQNYLNIQMIKAMVNVDTEQISQGWKPQFLFIKHLFLSHIKTKSAPPNFNMKYNAHF